MNLMKETTVFNTLKVNLYQVESFQILFSNITVTKLIFNNSCLVSDKNKSFMITYRYHSSGSLTHFNAGNEFPLFNL